MAQLTRYTNDGHRFDIDGIMDVGYNIEVTVIPAKGYKFVQWMNDNDNITEIDRDESNHRRFDIYIEECGITLSALFAEDTVSDECNFNEIYVELNNMICNNGTETYSDNDTISCDKIDELLKNIICN